MIPLERKQETQGDLLVAGLVPIPEENGRSESIPRAITSKNSGRSKHPLSMVK
jgi:hypothetical protein